MKPSLLQALGQPLSVHATLVGMGIESERAMQIITNHKDLSFKPKYMSLTQTFRDQLKSIAVSIDVNINSMLNMLTCDQIDQAIEDHKGFKWSDPDCDDKDQTLTLTGITKSSDNVWWLAFDVFPFVGNECSFQLCDLNIEDVLAFMQTVENTIDPTINRNEKVNAFA